MRVIIAGGGIGGLTAALALHARGHDVTVYEAADPIRALGVGINLLPHAVRVLTDLGLAGGLDEIAVRTADLSYYTRRGQLIWREARGLDAGYQWPQYSVHRGRLQLLLLDTVHDRLGPDAVRPGHRLLRFAQDSATVDAWWQTTGAVTTTRADALIAADGIHSVVRAFYYPDEGEPFPSGRLLWRAVTEGAAFLGGRSMIMAGHAAQKFVAYPIDPHRPLVNWIAELDLGPRASLPRRDWNRRGDRASFAPRFSAWRFPWLDVPALIAGAIDIYEFPMVDRDPLPRWTFGRITLLGDAAHPMYPIGSNGASQAILDAARLADALDGSSDPETAFAAYEADRRPATAQIVLGNRAHGPEIVMQMVEERAPNGFTDLEAVIPRAELEAIAERYKRTAGFHRDNLS